MTFHSQDPMDEYGLQDREMMRLEREAKEAIHEVIRQQKAVAMTRVCLWRLREERRAIVDAHGKDSIPAYLDRCIDTLSCFESTKCVRPDEHFQIWYQEFGLHLGIGERNCRELFNAARSQIRELLP